MRIATVSLLLLSLAVAAWAGDLPDAPGTAKQTSTTVPAMPASAQTTTEQPEDLAAAHTINPRAAIVFPKKIFWPAVIALGTSAVFDAQMSHGYIFSHPNAAENVDWLLGRRPSLPRYYATFAAMDGAAVLISYKLLHSHHKPVRILGWTVLGGMMAIHTNGDILMAE